MSTYKRIPGFEKVLGARVPDDAIEIIGQSLEDMLSQWGKNRPANTRDFAERVARAAKLKTHPLHAYIYDKSPRQIITEYAIERAEYLIRSVKIRVEYLSDPNAAPTPISIRLLDRSRDQDIYVPGLHMFTNEELRAERIADLKDELESWLQRAAGYEELRDLSEAIRKRL